MDKESYSVFVSHATEDKIEYVEDLVAEIKKLGISVFYNNDMMYVCMQMFPLIIY